MNLGPAGGASRLGSSRKKGLAERRLEQAIGEVLNVAALEPQEA